MTSRVRKAVSKKKRRYVDKKNNLDLDLSYITKKVVAMGFPSESVEGMYRNPYSEVIRWLTLEHKEHNKVYNLCSERGYPESKFDKVAVFPFDDHNPPVFEMIEEFCLDVHDYLESAEANVACIHCKAGKGRTGTMICCYLLYAGQWENADDAMAYYAAMRTYNQKGVTIPSQIRYIHYFERYLRDGYPGDLTLNLQKILLHKTPKVDHPSSVRFSLIIQKRNVFTHKGIDKKVIREAQKLHHPLVYECDDGGVPVCRDIKVIFEEKKGGIGGTYELLFAFWFNTAFVDGHRLVLTQAECDRANKDRNNKIFPSGFKVELVFADHPDGLNLATANKSSSPVSVATRDASLSGGAMGSSSSSLPLSAVAASSSSAAAAPSSPRSGAASPRSGLPKGRRPTNTRKQAPQRRDYSTVLEQFPSLQNL